MIPDGINCSNPDCKHGEGYHAKDFPRVCGILRCPCNSFEADSFLPSNFFKYLNDLPNEEKQVHYILTNIGYLRNEDNDLYVIDHMIMTDGMKDRVLLSILKAFRRRIIYLRKQKVIKVSRFETIRRSKQLVVARNPEKFGPYDPNVIQEKQMKQTAWEEYLTTC